jgi:hypothetical protein
LEQTRHNGAFIRSCVGEPLKRSVRFLILKITTHHLEGLPGPLSDLDLTQSGIWVGLTEIGDKQSLSFGGKVIKIPEPFRFPKIAAIDDETVLLVNSRAWTEKNAFIIRSSGEVRAQFRAGDAIQNVLASDKFIVVTYFDESALTSSGIEGNGVAIFDEQGDFLFGYRDLFGDAAVDIADCYAACWADDNRLLFFPYTDFPLVDFDLENKTQTIWEPPGVVSGSGAITALGENVFFHGPYRDDEGIYEWQIGSDLAKRIGSYSGSLRGIRNGMFLAVERDGYTLLSPPEIQQALAADSPVSSLY